MGKDLGEELKGRNWTSRDAQCSCIYKYYIKHKKAIILPNELYLEVPRNVVHKPEYIYPKNLSPVITRDCAAFI